MREIQDESKVRRTWIVGSYVDPTSSFTDSSDIDIYFQMKTSQSPDIPTESGFETIQVEGEERDLHILYNALIPNSKPSHDHKIEVPFGTDFI